MIADSEDSSSTADAKESPMTKIKRLISNINTLDGIRAPEESFDSLTIEQN